MFKLISIIFAVVLGFSLSACGSEDTSAGSTPIDKASAEDRAPSFTGAWATDANPDLEMQATITGNSIKILWVTPSQDTKALYWKGTFPTSNPERIVSKADVEALSGSILGSQDKTKVFTYDGAELSFDFTVMGTTKTMHLRKER